MFDHTDPDFLARSSSLASHDRFRSRFFSASVDEGQTGTQPQARLHSAAPPSLTALMRPDFLPSPLSRLHIRRRRPLVLLGAAVLAVLLLSQVPTMLSLTRLAAMRISALSISTHESAPLPVVVPGLLAASWQGTTEDPATFLKLHIFSEDTPAGRLRRDVIRKYSPTAWVKPGTVELKFVVPGHPNALLEIDASDGDPHGEPHGHNGTKVDDRIAGIRDGRRSRNRNEITEVEQRGAVDAEADEFGDVLRVPGHDVAAEWISAVGRAESARWVVKADDSVSTPRCHRRQNARTVIPTLMCPPAQATWPESLGYPAAYGVIYHSSHSCPRLHCLR